MKFALSITVNHELREIIVAGIIVGFFFGIFGLLWSIVVSAVLAVVVNGYYSTKLIDYSYRDQIGDIGPTALNSILLFGVVNTVYQQLQLPLFMNVVLAGLAGLIGYLGISYLVKMPALRHTVEVLKKNSKL